MDKMIFAVKGMRCAGCAENLRKRISKLEGIKSCSVNIAANSMVLECDKSKITPDAIISAVRSAGFQATIAAKPSDAFDRADEASSAWLLKFLLAGAFSILLSCAAMHRMFHLPWIPVSEGWNSVIQFILLCLLIPPFISVSSCLKAKR